MCDASGYRHRGIAALVPNAARALVVAGVHQRVLRARGTQRAL
jgi:hypothetical protein